MAGPVDGAGDIAYDLALPLDAEALAEEGIREAYREMAPFLAERDSSTWRSDSSRR
jgi:hypothetical protein